MEPEELVGTEGAGAQEGKKTGRKEKKVMTTNKKWTNNDTEA